MTVENEKNLTGLKKTSRIIPPVDPLKRKLCECTRMAFKRAIASAL